MPVTAYVLARVKPGTSEDLVGSRKIRGVKMANSVFGHYDAVLVITAKDMDELSKTIYDVVEAHPNVVRTECLISIPSLPSESEAHPQKSSDKFSPILFQCPSCNLLNEHGSVYCKFCGYVFNEP
ncbi:MAG: Lrp/AsnC family transcriptional regulator [Nitrososphaerota archaeon]|nr:Lrp/AsnC family transcriptional regulator [Nitrososphaerota archaeon]